jgi:MFS family permease
MGGAARTGGGTGALVAACAVVLGVSWNIGSAGAAADVLAAAYAVPLASIGLLTTAMFGVQLVTQLPAGRAIDRLGPRPVAAAALALAAAGNALLAAGDAFGLALAGRVVAGLGVGLGFLAGARLVQLAGGGVVATGIYGGVGLGGGGLALAVVPALDGALGWRAPWVSGLVALVPGAVALLGTRAARAPAPPPGAPLRALAADPRLRRLAVLQVASFGFGVVLATWTVPLLERAGLGRATAGVLGGLVLLLGIAGRPAGGALARRRPDRVPVLLTASLLAAAAGAALLAAAPSVPVLAALGAGACGVAVGLPFGPVLMGAAAARPDAPGAAVGLVNTAGVAAIVAGAPLLGLTFSAPGEGRLGVAVLAGLWVVCAVITRPGTAPARS